MIRYVPIAALALLAGCGLTTAQQASLTTAAETVASVAASQNITVAAVIAGGELFCSGASVFAVNTSVIGKAAADVAAACKAIDAIAVPVSPPANAASVPVVAPASPTA